MRLKMMIIIICFVYVSPSTYCQIPELVEGWPFLRETELYAFDTTPRFSNDSSIAIFHNTLAGDINKFHLDGSFYSGWPLEVGSSHFNKTPIVLDIDHDGQNEVITDASDSIYIVDDDGSLFSGNPLYYGNISSLSAADFDSDGEYEMIFYSRQASEIYCIDRFGNMEPGWPVSIPEDSWTSIGGAGTVGDLDLDGYLEFLLKGLKNIYAYRYDGTLQEGFPLPVIDTVFYYNEWFGPSLADIDQDGFLEILLSAYTRLDQLCSTYVAVYEHNGQIKDGWPILYTGDVFAWQMPIAADINNDGILEIGFALSDYQTYFVDINGISLPGWPASFVRPDGRPRAPMSDIIVVDIDGDGDCEIFSDYNGAAWDSSSEYYYSYLFAADHLGQDLPGYPIIVEGSYLARPPTFGFDSFNQQLYMGLCTHNAYVDFEPWVDSVFLEVFLFPDSTGPPDQWPMFCHDNLMTRNYNFVDYATGIDEVEEPLPKTYTLTQNYPNPFNASTIIHFSLPQTENINLTVYDILGRKVEELAVGEHEAGKHQVIWQAEGYASGLYFCVLQTEKSRISRKMIFLR